MKLDGSLFGPGQPCFGCSPDHPFGFRLRFEREGDEIVTRFTPSDRYQGPPGIMHGGLVMTVADELAAWAVIAKTGKFGFTAQIHGKLAKPVRVGVELEGRAKLTRDTPRIVEVDVRFTQRGISVFSGAVTFVLVDKAGAERLLGVPLPDAWSRFSRDG
jgi:acyl-coenzyme A thioesterase PaaI-like protein